LARPTISSLALNGSFRRSHTNRCTQGGVFQFPIYGYIKRAGAKSDAEVRKDPAAEDIYKEWFRKLEDGATFAEIADWLNDRGVPMGPFSRSSRWDGTMVGRVTRNPLLKGVRRRNDKISRRVNKTGRRHSVKAPPEERLERHCPHLAFFDPVYYDRVIRIVDEWNGHCRRNGKDGRDSRLGMPRKRTAWPGQHLRCGICNRLYYWTGSAAQKCMTCSGAQNYKCWNSIVDNGERIARKLAAAIFPEIMALPDFDGVRLGQLRQHWDSGRLRSSERQQEIRRQLAGVDQQIANVIAAIAEMGGNRALQDKLVQLEGDRDCLRDQSSQLERVVDEAQPLPSLETIKRKARELFVTFAPDAPEMHRLMCQLVPDLRAYPYQICDGGAMVLRARVELNLVALSDTTWPGTVPAMLRREMVVDLFEAPQRVRFRQQVTTLRAEGLTERQIAAQLGITQPAVQRAAALSRRMDQLGITDPYVLLTASTNASGLRRHLHRRYRFEPKGDSTSVT
jgi:site-specific DNA recombinase